MKNLTWQNPEQLFVAQELINKVKSKCCGIKVTFAAAIERKLLLYWKSVFKTTHLGLNRRLAPVSMTTQIRAKKGPKMTRSTCIQHKSYSNVLYASFLPYLLSYQGLCNCMRMQDASSSKYSIRLSNLFSTITESMQSLD